MTTAEIMAPRAPECLAAAAPDLSVLSPHLFAACAMRRLQAPRVLWLNERWLLEQGVDIARSEVLEDIRQWLMRDFAGAAVEAPAKPNGWTMYADRYGAAGGARHGGSGRVATSGRFNAKGIGRTPLAAKIGDWVHMHGRLWLHDAIREAICAEIARAELPYGAVPVLAILDAPEHAADAGQPRSAIVVRPNFVRPAHFERSVFFGDAGRPNADQHIDALRTREAIGAVTGDGEHMRRAGIHFDGLSHMFTRFARLIGETRAHRLWQGQFSTSNLSITGEMADFGSFRAMPNWQRAVGEPNQAFGDDVAAIRGAVHSIAFFFCKYAHPPHHAVDPAALIDEIHSEIDIAFRDACMRALGLDATIGKQTAAILAAFYEMQQAHRFQLRPSDRTISRRPWLYPALLSHEPAEQPTVRDAVEELRALWSRFEQPNILPNAARWLRPRPLLYYEVASRKAENLVARLRGDERDCEDISRHIQTTLTASRRLWWGAPPHLQVNAQLVGAWNGCLECIDPRDGARFLWCDAPVIDEHAYIFGSKVSLARLERAIQRRAPGTVSLLFPGDAEAFWPRARFYSYPATRGAA